MRLSNAHDRPERDLIAVLHAALDAGATLLDTADVYGPDASSIGHNERLIAAALKSWSGPRETVVTATKAGLVRNGSRWIADGRAKHITAACESSRRNLNVDRIDLFQVHAPDPRTKWTTTVRALAKLHAQGHIARAGLCNVNMDQIALAREFVEVATVQIALNLFDDVSIRNGVVSYCRKHGITVLAHSPLGGPKRAPRHAKNAVLRDIAAAREVEPGDVALTWLCDLDPCIVPLPGATRIETARRAIAAQTTTLTDDERGQIDETFPASRILRIPLEDRRADPNSPGEVVVFVGIPAAGKSERALDLASSGSRRLNRDEIGGRLSDLVTHLRDHLETAGPDARVVMDNTYPTRVSRNEVIETAWAFGVPARCVWLQTSLEDAQINAVHRMLDRYDRLLEPKEMATMAREDPSVIPPKAQFAYLDRFEPPSLDEGFASIEEIPFVRRHDPSHTNRAVIVELDGVLRRSRDGHRAPIDPDDVIIDPSCADQLTTMRNDGWLILGIAWHPELDEGTASRAQIDAVNAHTQSLLGFEIDIVFCSHRAGPPVCWCRRPLPGLGVLLIRRHRLDPSRCVLVGSSPADRTFASRLGFEFVDADTFAAR